MIHALLRRSAVPLLLALIVSACVPVYRTHGYVPGDDALTQVQVGQTMRDQLPSLLGEPSAQGLLTGAPWFYAKSRFRHSGPWKPREVERDVVAISFDSSGRVANVERFGIERGRIVTLSQRVTDESVSAMSALRQILGNFGRFRADQFFGDES